jgi:hypothetical protein
MPLRRSSMSARGSVCVILLAAASAILAMGLLSTGCSRQTAAEAKRGDTLRPGVAVSIDLDGDGTAENVLVEDRAERLTITDGSTVYRSREKWHVAAACLGDTDGNGLPEVVTLLDASDGRHLGLFGYSPDGDDGEYRERLVTGVLQPRPLAIRVTTVGETVGEPNGADGTAGGDLLVITEQTASGGSDSSSHAKDTTYRWNGFGFTALGVVE